MGFGIKVPSISNIARQVVGTTARTLVPGAVLSKTFNNIKGGGTMRSGNGGGVSGGPTAPNPDAEYQALKRRYDTFVAQSKQRGPGYEAMAPNEFEDRAGVMPPGYEGTRNARTGELLGQYKINPFAGEASTRLRAEALGSGPSPWASAALSKQGFDESQARAASGLQQQTAQSQAQSGLMRFGGLGGGARTSLARSGARDALMANQAVGAQGIGQRYNINNQDTLRRQELLGTTADVERQADLKNLGTTTEDMNRRAAFDMNRYNQQMGAWGAKQAADATRSAVPAPASSSGGFGGFINKIFG